VGQLCCRGLFVTLACAIAHKLGDEWGHRLQSVLELNTTLTEMDLSCESFVFAGGRGWEEGCHDVFVLGFWFARSRVSVTFLSFSQSLML
jgi:hypothetical protein